MNNYNVTPLAYTINDACRATGIGRTSLYKILKRGDLKAHKAGRRTLIPYAELQRYMAGLPAYTPNKQPPANVAMNAVHWCLQNRAALTDFAIRLLKFLIFLHNNGGA